MTHTSILKPRWLVTVNDDFDVLTNTALIVENDIIKAIVPVSALDKMEGLEQAEIIELDNHVLMPGLVNTHTHAAMSLLRGIHAVAGMGMRNEFKFNLLLIQILSECC